MPDLSVVIPSVNGFGDLDGCLRALEAQREDVELEVLVVDRLGDSLRALVRERYPFVRIVDAPRATTIPQLRALGFDAATAPAVAVIEDHVLVRRGWARQLIASLAEGAAAVGGPIENAATDTTLDWAAFLCEYSHCLPPLPTGPVEWLPGNNVAYPRALLQQHADVIAEHRWEDRLHEVLRSGTRPLVCHPELVVDHKKHFTFREYMELRYQFSRSFAGVRLRGATRARQLAFAAGSLILPPILFWRTVSRIRAKGRHERELKQSLPYIACFVVAWAAGEFVGYLAGPGDSLSRVT